MVPGQVGFCCRLRRPGRLLLLSHRSGPDSCQATSWCRHNTLAAACCSPCPWACHRRRDLSSTASGSSGILITARGGAFRGCLLIAGRLRPACVHLVRAYRCRASGRDTRRPGGPQQPTSVSALSSWPGCAADRSTSGECCRTALAVGDAVGARILVGRSDGNPGF